MPEWFLKLIYMNILTYYTCGVFLTEISDCICSVALLKLAEMNYCGTTR